MLFKSWNLRVGEVSSTRDLLAKCSLTWYSVAATLPCSGSEKGVFWKRGLFRKIHFLENLEILEILENPQTVENKREADHFLEILENLEILEIPLVKRPLS